MFEASQQATDSSNGSEASSRLTGGLFDTKPGEEIPSVVPKKQSRKEREREYQKEYRAKQKALAAKGKGTASSEPSGPASPQKTAAKEAPGVPLPDGLIDALADIPYFVAGLVYRAKTGRTLVIPGAGAIKPMVLGPDQVRASYEESKRAFVTWMKASNVKVPAWSLALGSYALTVGGAVALDLTGLAQQAMMAMQAEAAAKAQAQAMGATVSPTGAEGPAVTMAQDTPVEVSMGATIPTPAPYANGADVIPLS